jgi:hypothetical protein
VGRGGQDFQPMWKLRRKKKSTKYKKKILETKKNSSVSLVYISIYKKQLQTSFYQQKRNNYSIKHDLKVVVSQF